jgi:hypothetical protein
MKKLSTFDQNIEAPYICFNEISECDDKNKTLKKISRALPLPW